MGNDGLAGTRGSVSPPTWAVRGHMAPRHSEGPGQHPREPGAESLVSLQWWLWGRPVSVLLSGAFVGGLFSPPSLKFFFVLDFLRLRPHVSYGVLLLFVLLRMWCVPWIPEVCF